MNFLFGKRPDPPREARVSRRRNIVAIGAISFVVSICASGIACGQAPRLIAPNVVEISPRLVTSGQPSAEALAGLKGLAFDAVIYLASPTVPDAVRDEQIIVTRQGLTFINIPIKFESPTEADFEVFASVLDGLGTRKVLVHCQINLRASAMVFLYRVINLKDEPRVAYESVAGVWSPDGRWRRLIEDQLRKHKVAFEPY
jgi:protein tyrosine phosphatase (PTP) superfamily phosphohydrolase (DUF442 family)